MAWVSLLFILFFFLVLIAPIHAINAGNIGLEDPSPSPPPFGKKKRDLSPFKPGIAVIVGGVTTIFSITFLLLLYVKHCKRGSGVHGYTPSQRPSPPSALTRNNSGIDRAVIVSLPIFRFDSLSGQKDGLECAVCLARFESTEVLRLLPKCKHAFHVECVDIWLDAHSTCPLCRYRVDPEDILLVQDHVPPPPPPPPPSWIADSNTEIRRVSGRHSSAGEKRSVFRGTSDLHYTMSFRRSVDGAGLRKKSEIVAVGCFDRGRKDGLLLTDALASGRKSFDRRFEHRIVVAAGSQLDERWSNVHPSDLLYLRSENIIICVGRAEENDRSVVNGRSVSEITGLKRYESSSSRYGHNGNGHGVVSRWMAWMSSLSQPAVRSDRSNSESVPPQMNSV